MISFLLLFMLKSSRTIVISGVVTRRLGHGDTTSYIVPKLVEALQEDVILDLSCACWHTVAVVLVPPLLKGGVVYTWGSGRVGQVRRVAFAESSNYCATTC